MDSNHRRGFPRWVRARCLYPLGHDSTWSLQLDSNQRMQSYEDCPATAEAQRDGRGGRNRTVKSGFGDQQFSS